MTKVLGQHPTAEAITNAVSRTALWNLTPLPAASYPADWAQVTTAEARALRQHPEAREEIRAQVRTTLRQMRDGVARSGAYGPVERKAAIEFINAIEIEEARK
jgi:hypothetical protein